MHHGSMNAVEHAASSPGTDPMVEIAAAAPLYERYLQITAPTLTRPFGTGQSGSFLYPADQRAPLTLTVITR